MCCGPKARRVSILWSEGKSISDGPNERNTNYVKINMHHNGKSFYWEADELIWVGGLGMNSATGQACCHEVNEGHHTKQL